MEKDFIMLCTSNLPNPENAENQRLLYEIEQRGYHELSHGIPPDQIEEAVQAYADFTLNHPDPSTSTMDIMLPESLLVDELGSCRQLDDLSRRQDNQTQWHKYRTNLEAIGKPKGYANRTFQMKAIQLERGLKIVEDPKEFFHYTPRLLPAIRLNHAQFGWGSIPVEVEILDKKFMPIHKKAREIIKASAAQIEIIHPGVKSLFSLDSLFNSPLRLLFYHTQESAGDYKTDGDLLGGGHYDKDALTLSIAESHSGIRIAKNSQSDLELLHREPEEAILYAGHQMQNRFGDDTMFKSAWHDIVTDETLNRGRVIPPNASNLCARWAMIFFANGSEFAVPDKNTLHTR